LAGQWSPARTFTMIYLTVINLTMIVDFRQSLRLRIDHDHG